MSVYRDLIVGDRPLAYWRLGEAPGAAALADTMGAFPLTTLGSAVILGAAGLLREDADAALGCHAGSALSFASRPPTPALAFPGLAPFSVEFWAWTLAATGTKIVASHRATSGDLSGWTVQFNLGGSFSFLRADAATLEAVSYPAPVNAHDGLPHHYVCEFDGATYTSYMDGTARSVNAPAPPKSIGTVGGNLTIGNISTPGTGSWPDVIDELAIYGYALSPGQVKSHYAEGAKAIHKSRMLLAA